MKVGIAQISVPILDRAACVAKVVDAIRDAGRQRVKMLAFGEACIPGYPVWLDRAGGAEFDSPTQKAIHAVYLREAVCLEDGHLDPVVRAAADSGTHVVIGIIERPRAAQVATGSAESATSPARDRGASGHTVYCSLVHVTPKDGGSILSVHRKLAPTYEERLAWAHGDSEGLVTWPVGPFTVGGTLCFETWMPLPRAALQAQGEDLHVAVWPGSIRNTEDITRFVAKEGRSFVVSASCVLTLGDIPERIAPSGPAEAEEPAAAAAADAGGLPVLEAGAAAPTVDASVPLRQLCIDGHRGLSPSQGGDDAAKVAAAKVAARPGAVPRVPAGTAGSAPDVLDTVLHDGGSCIAGPDGAWIVSPEDTCDGKERLIVATLDLAAVRGERQNFDPAGHYSRPELLRLVVQRSRAAAAEFGTAAVTSTKA